MRILKKLLLSFSGIVVLLIVALTIDICTYPRGEVAEKADAAIVLGAAVWTDKPSPVLAERLNHAIILYKENKVKKVIVTGGLGKDEKFSEADVSEIYLIEKGIPAADILKETKSAITSENLEFSLPIVKANNISTVLIVSDPLHLRRAVKIARDLGLEAFPSATPTTRYQSFSSQISFLTREIFFYAVYLILGI